MVVTLCCATVGLCCSCHEAACTQRRAARWEATSTAAQPAAAAAQRHSAWAASASRAYRAASSRTRRHRAAVARGWRDGDWGIRRDERTGDVRTRRRAAKRRTAYHSTACLAAERVLTACLPPPARPRQPCHIGRLTSSVPRALRTLRPRAQIPLLLCRPSARVAVGAAVHAAATVPSPVGISTAQELQMLQSEYSRLHREATAELGTMERKTKHLEAMIADLVRYRPVAATASQPSLRANGMEM